jgi:hypothetical protein
MGAVSWDLPLRLLPLWPLLLVAGGLHLLIGSRNRWIPAAIWTGALAVGVAYVAMNGAFQNYGELARTSLSASLDGATSAYVRIESDQVTLNVDGNLDGGASSRLANVDLEYYPGIGKPASSAGKSGDQATLSIVQRGIWAFFNADRPSPVWSIHLNPGVPTDLNVKAGAGTSTLDLQKMKLTRLSFAVGAGNAAITLPAGAGNTAADIDGGVGNLDLIVPAGVEARIRIETGIGNSAVDSRFVKSGNTYTSKDIEGAMNRVDVKIRAGIGNVNVNSKTLQP